MTEAKAAAPTPGLTIAPWPDVDHSAFGPIQSKPITRIQKVVGAMLSRNWVMIPHVTHNDDADISGLDDAGKRLSERSGIKVTPLAYMIKAAVHGLKAYPRFNASLDSAGAHLILKQYFHIGFAVDTPNGLVVPVIRDADRKTLTEIAAEVAEVSTLARTKGLPMDRMSGGCFSISSLGSIGGTSFTPIINAPEVAIMGTTRSVLKPVSVDGELVWRTMLPLSLSYDHRVINGADAARFCIAFAEALSQPDALGLS